MSCSLLKRLLLRYMSLLKGEQVGVGSISGGGRYDDLVGMFDAKGRKVVIIFLFAFHAHFFH